MRKYNQTDITETLASIQRELEMALKHRYVEVDNSRLCELAALVACFYNKMRLYGITYKEAGAIIAVSESLLDRVPIGRLIN